MYKVNIDPAPSHMLLKGLVPVLILGAIIFAIYQYRNYCYQYEQYKINMEQQQEQQSQTVIKE